MFFAVVVLSCSCKQHLYDRTATQAVTIATQLPMSSVLKGRQYLAANTKAVAT
jgi:hypothetical protein